MDKNTEWLNDPKVDPIAKALMSMKLPDYYFEPRICIIPKKKYYAMKYDCDCDSDSKYALIHVTPNKI